MEWGAIKWAENRMRKLSTFYHNFYPLKSWLKWSWRENKSNPVQITEYCFRYEKARNVILCVASFYAGRYFLIDNGRQVEVCVKLNKTCLQFSTFFVSFLFVNLNWYELYWFINLGICYSPLKRGYHSGLEKIHLSTEL